MADGLGPRGCEVKYLTGPWCPRKFWGARAGDETSRPRGRGLDLGLGPRAGE